MTTENKNTAPGQTQKKEQKEVKTKSEQPVDKAVYDKYTSLKFLQLSGAKLEEKVKKELDSLEQGLKNCSGKIPIRTVRAAINNEQVLIVEGIPLPEDYTKIVQSCKNPEYYFG
jgi:hypothetical protein